MASWAVAADQAVGMLHGLAPANPWMRAAGVALAIGGRGMDLFTNRRLARDQKTAPKSTDLLEQQMAWLTRQTSPTPPRTAGATSRYLAEEGKASTDDTDCFNCASAHLAALAASLDNAASAAEHGDTCDDACQQWMRLAVQEPGILLEHDWPDDKTWPADQQAVVDRYRPQVQELLVAALGDDTTAQSRSMIALAAAGLKESTRFTKSGDPIDHPEVEKRRLKAEQRLAGAERLDVTAFEGPVADDLRHVRQQVSGGITDASTLTHTAQRADRLSQVVNAPAFGQQNPQHLRQLARQAQALQEQFAAERRQHTAPALGAGLPEPVFTRTAKFYEDTDTRIPDVLAQSLLEDPATPPAPTESLNTLLGATPRTEVAMHNLLRLDAARKVPVRIEELPAVIEDGQYAGQILGAYYPAGHAILLGPQVFSEDAEDVNTVAEETAHSLLHNHACDVYPPEAKQLSYLEIPEEREAKTATLLALLATGLPFETDTGRQIPAGTIRQEADTALDGMEPLMRHRTSWAANILVQAINGDIHGAAAQADVCPRQLPTEVSA